MPENVLILSSSRAYEFPPDGVRLTAICTDPVLAAVKSAFAFNVAVIGGPMPTFGPVPQTLPPGAVFNFGLVESAGGVVPIRYLHVEAARLVVDVAGPSATIDVIRSSLLEVLAGVPVTAAGAMVEPIGVRDKSTIVTTLEVPPHALFPTPVLAAIGPGDYSPTLAWHAAPIDAPLEVELEGAEAWALQLRAGVPPSAQRYFSAAPVTSDEHLDFLTRLEQSVRKRRA
jgi:hypothetical protein